MATVFIGEHETRPLNGGGNLYLCAGCGLCHVEDWFAAFPCDPQIRTSWTPWKWAPR